MKKQILILILFVAATVAGTSKSYGQTQLDSSIVSTYPLDTLSCEATSLPLHPMPGVSYTYRMDGEVGQDSVKTWTWFATKDSIFISPGVGLDTTDMLYVTPGELLDASSYYGTFNVGEDSVQITWSPSILQRTDYQADVNLAGSPPSPTFVVGYGVGECSDNIEVYEIDPVPAFVIDIANIDANGDPLNWGVVDSSCVSEIESAVYDQANNRVNIDYGSDTLYFEVAAKNFVTSFTPTLTIVSGLNQNQEADISIYDSWAEALTGNATDMLGTGEVTFAWDNTGIDSTSFGGVELTAVDDEALVEGASFWVRVIIHNNQYESVVRNPFILAVDGLDASGQWDLEDADCGTDYGLVDYDTDDQATHVITPRPEINALPGEPTNDPNTTLDTQPGGETNLPEDAVEKDEYGSLIFP